MSFDLLALLTICVTAALGLILLVSLAPITNGGAIGDQNFELEIEPHEEPVPKVTPLPVPEPATTTPA
jgi:hypothetical protein